MGEPARSGDLPKSTVGPCTLSMSSELSDIWARVLGGDHAAWEELVDLYATLVYSVARRSGLDDHDAEDCAQQTWVALYISRHRIHDWQKLPGWLSGTAYRRAMRILRKRASTQRVESKAPPAPTPLSPDQQVILLQRRALLERALARLDVGCRDLLTALFFAPGEKSYGEIARSFNIPINSIGPMRQRCLARLRKILKEMGENWYEDA